MKKNYTTLVIAGLLTCAWAIPSAGQPVRGGL